MTEFIKQNPDFLVATSIPTEAEIAKELEQGRARFDLVDKQIKADRAAYWADQNNAEVSWGVADDIAFMRRAYESAPAYNELVDRAIVLMDKKRFG